MIGIFDVICICVLPGIFCSDTRLTGMVQPRPFRIVFDSRRNLGRGCFAGKRKDHYGERSKQFVHDNNNLTDLSVKRFVEIFASSSPIIPPWAR